VSDRVILVDASACIIASPDIFVVACFLLCSNWPLQRPRLAPVVLLHLLYVLRSAQLVEIVVALDLIALVDTVVLVGGLDICFAVFVVFVPVVVVNVVAPA